MVAKDKATAEGTRTVPGGIARAAILVAVLVGLLAPAAEAGAATVSVGPSEIELAGPPIIYEAAVGEANVLTISSLAGDPEAVVVRDAGAAITPGEGCTEQSDGSVLCRVDGLAGVRVTLDDGDDRLDASGLVDRSPPRPQDEFFAFEASGGDGADELIGANASYSCLAGDAGDDTLSSGAASKTWPAICDFLGGEGADTLLGNDLDDQLDGGPGADVVRGEGGRDGGYGGGGRDLVELGSDRDFGGGGGGEDRVLGGSGDDVLANDPGADEVLGGSGDDLFRIDFRRAGRDELRGGLGDDTAKFTCPSCRVSLNARADDGERGGEADDNVLETENLITSSTRFDAIAEGIVEIGRGNDILIGDRRDNVLRGNRGPDVIRAAGGADRLHGGSGDDALRADDGERDSVRCGGGEDVAAVDPGDRVRGCEQVRSS